MNTEKNHISTTPTEATGGESSVKKLPTFKKPTKNQTKRFIIHALLIILGNAITAGAAAFFIIPNNFVMGGATGIGIFVRNLFERGGKTVDLYPWVDWVINIVVYGVNIVLFAIGALFMGKKFATGTLAGTLLYPTFMTAFKPLNDLYVKAVGMPMGGSDQILAAFFGGVIFGLGIGIVVHVGASTGGTDIPPMIMHKYFNLPVSVTLIGLDCTIIAIQLVCVDLDTALIGIFITIVSSVVIEVVSPIGTRRSQVKVISKKYKEIRQMILTKMNRGVTMLYGRTGFLQENCYVILTVVSNREVVKLKNEIWKIDPAAFLTISVIGEVRGNGFSTAEKIALPKHQMTEDLIDVTEEFKDGAPFRPKSSEERETNTP